MIGDSKSLEAGLGAQRQVVPDGVRSQSGGRADRGFTGLDRLLLLQIGSLLMLLNF